MPLETTNPGALGCTDANAGQAGFHEANPTAPPQQGRCIAGEESDAFAGVLWRGAIWRVIAGRCGLQWIGQRTPVNAAGTARWRSEFYCTTPAGLMRLSPRLSEPDRAAFEAFVVGLPEHFPRAGGRSPAGGAR